MSQQLNKLKAEYLKDDGLFRAVNNADNTIDKWSESAYAMFLDYLLMNSNIEFLAEDARVWCEQRGLATPPNKRAWGGIITKANNEGIIKFCGYGKTSNPQAHRAIAAIWRKA